MFRHGVVFDPPVDRVVSGVEATSPGLPERLALSEASLMLDIIESQYFSMGTVETHVELVDRAVAILGKSFTTHAFWDEGAQQLILALLIGRI